MSTRHLLDPELLPLVEAMPALDFSQASIERIREMLSAQLQSADASAQGVVREEISFISQDGTTVSGLLYKPATAAASIPGYLHIHGGGYVLGSALMADAQNVSLVAALGIVVLSVEYRLAPEYPIPAPLEDCYAGLAWLAQNASELGVDPTRIAIGGESAGGGLAAALAIYARDLGEYAICHQHLTYPMLDNLTGSESQPGDPLTGEFVWTRNSNAYGWQSYLGDSAPVAPQVPARLEDFAGLPPAWIYTAGLDLFRDENIAYAQKLMAAGVATELVVLPGACHGFQQLPGTRLAKHYASSHLAALSAGLGLAPQ